MKYIALLRRLIAKPAPVPPVPPVASTVVYRGETVLSVGASNLGADTAAPAKLSAEEVRRCFGVEQGA